MRIAPAASFVLRIRQLSEALTIVVFVYVSVSLVAGAQIPFSSETVSERLIEEQKTLSGGSIAQLAPLHPGPFQA